MSSAVVQSNSSRKYSGFDPRTIDGCALWFDAADRSTLTLVGSAVSAWADKSSNGYNVSQGTAANRPTYTENLLNGRPGVVATGGTVGTLTNSSVATANLFEGGANFTTFIVMRLTSPLSTDNTSPLAMVGANTRCVQFGFGPSGSFRYAVDCGQIASPRFTTTNASMFGSNVIHQVSRSSTTTFGMRTNGTALTTATVGTATNTITDSTLALNVVFQSSPTFVPIVRLFEILHYNRALTLSETQQVEGYLAWKWGLVSSLPGTHPYKYNPVFTRLFLPIDIPNCLLWLDAADETTVIRSGSNVTQWTDKSGNGNNATTALGTLSYSNGIVFTGSQAMTTPLSSVMTSQSIFVIASANSGALMNIIGVDAPTYSNGIQVALNNYLQSVTRYGGTPIMSAAVNVGGAGVRFLYGVTYISGGQSFLYLNGSQTSNNVTSPTISGTATVSIGAYRDTAFQERYNGTINEILIYNTILTTDQRREIEGYLARKWGISSSLPTSNTFRLYPPLTPLFNPLQIPNCALWLDAVDVSGNGSTLANGTSVSTWVDKSGNGRNFVQLGSFAVPTVSTNAINSLPCLSFIGIGSQNSGANQILTNASIVLNSSASGYSIFTVARQNASAPSWTSYNYLMSSYTGAGIFYGTPPGTKFLVTSNGTAGGTSGFNDLTPNTPNTLMTTTRLTSISVIGSTLTPYLNGSVMGTKTGTCVSLTGLSVGDAYVPGQSYGGQNWGGVIGEILIFNANITTNQRQQIEGYLSWKWRLQGNLPTTHPYYKFRP
jgi:hypothetical protein